ncbi:MAG: hypothetical protein WDW38_000262 [Sanguina aurantia]
MVFTNLQKPLARAPAAAAACQQLASTGRSSLALPTPPAPAVHATLRHVSSRLPLTCSAPMTQPTKPQGSSVVSIVILFAGAQAGRSHSMPAPDAAAAAASSSLGGVLPTLIPHLNALFARRARELDRRWEARLDLAVRAAGEDAVRRFRVRSGLDVSSSSETASGPKFGIETTVRGGPRSQDTATRSRDMQTNLASQLRAARQERSRLLKLLKVSGGSQGGRGSRGGGEGDSLVMRLAYRNPLLVSVLMGLTCLGLVYTYAVTLQRLAGWQLPLENIDATLHLPRGYRLLGAIGADRSPDSWAAQWSLLDLFIVAIIALLAGRLLGWRWIILAVVYLVLAQHEDAAPRWTLAATAALGLLMRALPEGRLRVGAGIATLALFALMVLWTLPFVATQLQYALHPQLEGSVVNGSAVSRLDEPTVADVAQKSRRAMPSQAAMMAPAPAPSVESYASDGSSAASLQGSASPPSPSITVSASVAVASVPVSQEQNRPDLIQAGAGMPDWDQGNDYRLGWSGPVAAAQQTRLVIAPSWAVRWLRVLMVGLLATLLASLASLLLPTWRASWPRVRLPGAAVALLAIALVPAPSHAQALPDPALRQQLRERLTEAPGCAPSCAQVAQAQLQVGADTLDVALEAHIGAPTALPLPQPDDALRYCCESIGACIALPCITPLATRTARPCAALHYAIGDADSATLRFPLAPGYVSVAASGWTFNGVDDGRLLGDSVALSRVRAAADGKDAAPAQSFPPYVRLTRRLALGIDWTVENTAERIAPKDGGFSTTLPLLAGEHPLGEDALVADGRISVTFSAGSNTVQWRSRLEHATTLALKAPLLSDRAEVWQVSTAPMWHVEARGVPTSASDDGLRYQPLPGETLQLALSQPAAIAGDSLAIDRVALDSSTGDRVTETTLALTARSTRGGEHAIDLPPGAELLEARRDGVSINLAIRDGKLSLPLLPGQHAYALRLREPGGITARLRTPAFVLHDHVPALKPGCTV